MNRNPEGAYISKPDTAMPLFEQAHARKSDPATSWSAADSVQHLTQTRAGILEILRDYGPKTDEEIQAIYRARVIAGMVPNASPSGLRSRRAELVKLGLAAKSGIGTTQAGNACTIWRAL